MDVVVTVTLILSGDVPGEPVAVSVQLPTARGVTVNDPPVTGLVEI
jgi:hypothetical protein